MKIVFLTNAITPHQREIYSAFCRLINVNFCFIECLDIDKSSLPIGWQEKELDKVIDYRTFVKDFDIYKRMIDESDVVIIGSAPDKLIENRLKVHKLTFKYSERLYKTGFPIKKYLRNAAAAWLHHGRFQKYPIYMLCASAYTSADCAKFGNYKNRCYKWGYFPEIKKYENIESIINSKKKNSILWAGRLLDLKHPDTAVRIAKRLKQNGYDFKLNIIGAGDMEQKLNKMISDYNLENVVHMLGSMKPEQVREYMEQSQIFLFTSDRNEGWGAVLNESMNSACAVVASHEIGSVPFLLKDGENGLIYKDGDEEDLYLKIKSLLDSSDLCRQYGRQAYLTIVNEWNAETAAKRFIELSEAILNGDKKPDLFSDGPCSKAKILKDGWYIN